MSTRHREIAGVTNPILTKFAAGYKNANFIGRLVAPRVESLTETGTFYSLGKEGFYLYDTERALRTNARKIDFHMSKDTYACKEHALETSLDYKEIDIAEKYGANKVLDLKRKALSIVQRALEVDLEKAVSDILFGTSYYASGNKIALSGTSCWTDTTNSTPIEDIRTGKKAARNDMGIEPNTLVLGYLSWDALVNHPDITGKIKNSKNQFVTLDDLKEILSIPNIIVGQAVYATDGDVFTDLWDDSAALIYIPNEAEEPEGVPIHTVLIEEIGYPEVKEYSMKKTLDIEETQKYVVKNVNTSNGYLITNTNA